MGEKIELLVTVKTYPLPSTDLAIREQVCTAGVLRDGSFRRIYPVNFRDRPYWEWYSKYDWIELEVEKSQDDERPESFSPIPGTAIRKVGYLDERRNWLFRKQVVLAKGTQTMCSLRRAARHECSLGIVRPREVTDVRFLRTSSTWKPEWEVLFRQQRLFGPQQRPLEKIPYDFRYWFRCEDPNCPGQHKMIITDWDLGVLFRKMRDKFGDERVAAQKVRQKYLDQMCAPDVDTHFFVGTVRQYGTWIVLGVFWPKKDKQDSIW